MPIKVNLFLNDMKKQMTLQRTPNFTAAYGLLMHKPTVGDALHFAASGARPLGQNTDTSV